jgi:hypothetical protein
VNPLHPTPYPEVNAILLWLMLDVQAILSDQFTGMYLYGSLALGDFDPGKSDIDFLVVTTDELPDVLVAALAAMHARLAASSSKWAMELEGSYIPRRSLCRYYPNDTHHPHIDRGRGKLAIAQHDTDWVIQRYVLREHGVVVAGPDIRRMIDPISADELRQAVRDLLWWWELQLSDTSRVEESGYQAYAILSMCRILYTLEYGTVISKPAAARWAQGTLDERWRGLIERALTWQPGETMDRLGETLEFIRYTLACSQ